MTIKNIILLSLQIILLNVKCISAKKIFLDLGDVVIHTSYTSSLGDYLPTVFKYTLNGNSPFKGKNDYENFLISLYGRDPASGLPLIYRPWTSGMITGYDFACDVNSKIEKANISRAQKEFYKKVTSFFEPKKLIHSRRISKKALNTIQELQSKNHEIYILSNWDKESFPLLLEKFADFFATIKPENIVVSGFIGLIKPDVEFFDYVKTTYKLTTQDLTNSWFIDDRPENIDSAKKSGFNVILHKSWHDTKKALKQANLL